MNTDIHNMTTNGWGKVQLIEICEFINRGISPAYTDNSGTIIINQKCIRNGVVNLKYSKFTDESRKNIPLNKLLQNFDILINSTGTGTVGRVGQVVDVTQRTTVDTHVTIVRPKSNIIDPIFLSFYLRLKESDLENYATGSTNQVELSKSKIAELEVFYPSIGAQKSIARALLAAQKAFFTQESVLSKLFELKQSLVNHVFTKGTKNEKTKITDIGEIPENWDVAALKSLVPDIEYGVSQAIPKNKPEHGYKIVSTADITKAGEFLYDQLRYIDVKDSQAEKLRLKNGDVLFNWRNSLDHIGKTAIYTNHGDEHVIFASFILRLRCDEKKAHNRFISNLMNYYREKEVFSKLARRAVNQANYNRNEIYVLQIPSPSYEEQVEIADIIEKIDIKIRLAQRKLMLQQQLFSTLLHELMSGEREVKIN